MAFACAWTRDADHDEVIAGGFSVVVLLSFSLAFPRVRDEARLRGIGATAGDQVQFSIAQANVEFYSTCISADSCL
jgi:hypothetical protein